MHDGSVPRRILALSDYGSTGISESIRAPLTHWHNAGHIVSQLALGFNGWSQNVDKTMYPWYERLLPIFGAGSNDDRFGQKQIAKALRLTQAEIVISAFDVWMVNFLAQPEKANLDSETLRALAHDHRTFQHIAYFPLDGACEGLHLPCGMDEMIAGFDVPITYSRFAKKIIANDTNLDVPFIPIAHDPAVYKPGDRRAARKRLHLPEDMFIVAMVGTNQYRKAWGEFFEGVVPFARNHSDVAVLPWTTWTQKIAGGAEVEHFVWRSGLAGQIIDPKDLIGSLNDEGMAALYQAIDVLVLTTVGEGAGLPPLRARACGTPTLVSGNTSNVEFVGHPFELLPVNGRYYDPLGSNLERYTTDTAVLTQRLEEYYTNAPFRAMVAHEGIREMEQYEIANVLPLWDNVLGEL